RIFGIQLDRLLQLALRVVEPALTQIRRPQVGANRRPVGLHLGGGLEVGHRVIPLLALPVDAAEDEMRAGRLTQRDGLVALLDGVVELAGALVDLALLEMRVRLVSARNGISQEEERNGDRDPPHSNKRITFFSAGASGSGSAAAVVSATPCASYSMSRPAV